MCVKQKLVVVGGGFAGIYLVKHIDRRLYDVVLIDSNNYHSFPPLFYQIASAGLDPASILSRSAEMRKLKPLPEYHFGEVKASIRTKRLSQPNTRLYHMTGLSLQPAHATTSLAWPTSTNTFFTIKRTSEALRCRNEILDRFERAPLMPRCRQAPASAKLHCNRGGPTGVEIAGALGEMKRFLSKRVPYNQPRRNDNHSG